MARRRTKPAAQTPSPDCPFLFDAETWVAVVDTLGLAPQQARIVERILRGMCNKQIARDLGIGEPTVNTYLTRTYRRLGVNDRLQLVLRVFKAAWDCRSAAECRKHG